MRSSRSFPRRSRLVVALFSTAVLTVGTLAVLQATSSAESAASAQSADACAPGTEVQTTTGPVCGVVSNGVTEWLGIPYATPPVGALRWAPPQPHAPWTATLAATAFGSACEQAPNPFTPGPYSEDCLFVNVWRPSLPASDLPVLVHIHGGGFTLGSGAGDNTLLASRGHEIVVSMNYRLGILGFLANSALGEHSGDYGLQDQQAALRWVKDNIPAFGGDPHNVTIYGESAGGSSVCHHIASPTAAGLFQRGISVSGEYNTLLGVPTSLEAQDCKSALPTQAQADQAGATFAASLGCASATNVAECLRAASVTSVLAASGGTKGPTINGTTLPRTLRQALKTGRVNRVPVIAGVNRDENLVGTATTPEQYRALVDAQYGRFAQDVLRLYPLERFDSPFVAFRTIAADSNTVCPALVTDRGLARWMPVYAYEIDDTDAPLLNPFYPAPGVPNGSYHVAAWFLTPVNPPLNANQQVLQNEELAHVTTFARTGDPTALHTPVWPRFTPATEAVMSLQPGGDSEIVTADELSAQHHCRFWDRVGAKSD